MKKKRIRDLKENIIFIYNKHKYKFLGVTDIGKICTYRFYDNKYVIFDVDSIVLIEG